MGISLRKIQSLEDLFKCSATSRILVNQKVCGILFPSSPRLWVFVREEKGITYELCVNAEKITYLHDGSLRANADWKKSGRYVNDYLKENLKIWGMVD